MRAGLVALAGFMVLAGCVGDNPAAPQAVPTDEDGVPVESTPSSQPGSTDAPVVEQPTEVEDTGAKSFHFEQTYPLTITHVKATTHRVNQDPNCVSLGKDQVWLILNGTAEATWSSPGPFATKMTVDVRDIGLMATNNGTVSPSRVEFGRFQTVPNALLGLWFIVQPTDDGVVLQQPLQLTISFNYFGRPDLTTKVEPCVYTAAFEDEEAAQ